MQAVTSTSENSLTVFLLISIHLLFIPGIPLLGVHLREIKNVSAERLFISVHSSLMWDHQNPETTQMSLDKLLVIIYTKEYYSEIQPNEFLIHIIEMNFKITVGMKGTVQKSSYTVITFT